MLKLTDRHWDNYWLKGNNYYLYFNLTTGRLSYFSYDQDLTFGTLFLPELPGPYYTNVTQMDYSYAVNFLKIHILLLKYFSQCTP